MTEISEITTFRQLRFFRNMTVGFSKSLPDDLFDRIPEGQRNHIRWHLAHLWFVLERFVYHIGLNEYTQHDEHLALYGNGSSPAHWVDETGGVGSAAEWIERLAAQPARIEQSLMGKLDQPLAEPFTFANGYTVTTARELLTYGIFHEGMHLSSIRSYAKQLQGN